MRRFEFEEGGSSKFWEVSVDGSDMTVRYGRIGTDGQSKTKSFASGEAAQKEADKLVLEKTKKGYQEVGDATAAKPAAPAKPAAKPAAPAKAAAPAKPAAPAAAEESAAPAPSPPARSGESIVLEGETVFFAPPAAAIAEAEVSIDTPARARKVPSFEDTWKPLIKGMARWAQPSSYIRWPDASSGLSATDLALVERARARLEAKSAGDGFDLELEAFTLSLTHLVPSYESGDDPRAQAMRALAHWTSRTDPVTAARALLRAERIGAADYQVRPAVIRPVLQDPPGFDGSRAYALREHVRQHGRVALEPTLRELIPPTNPSRRATRAWILDDEAEATLAVAEARAGGHVHHAYLVLGLVPSATDAAELLLGTPIEASMLRAVLRHRLALAETVLFRGASAPSAGREWIHALSCYPSLPTARALVPFLERKPDRKLVGDALATMPAEAITALTEARGKKTKYRDAIDALLATLAASTAAATESTSSADEAPLDALPPVFQAPPWRAKKRAGAQAPIDGLVARAIEIAVDLSSLDAKKLASEVRSCSGYGRGGAEQLLAKLARGERVEVHCLLPLPVADLDRLRAEGAFAKLQTEYWAHDGYSPGLTAILAQHGAAAVPALIALAPFISAKLAAELAHAGAVEIAPLACQWLGGKATRKAAEQWAKRFPQHAAAGLVPIALAPGSSSKATTERERAAFLLAAIARAGHREVVLAEARHHGAEVEAAVAALLDRDPLELAPSKAPKLPDGVESLPRVALRDGRLMPREATTLLAEMLAFSPLDPPYAGLEQAKEACDPRSLDAFVEALVRTFVAAGMPTAHEWMVRAVALVGTDGAARFLFDRGRAWATDNQKQRAMLALDVLGAMGTDLALSLVGRVSRSAQRQYMKDRATEILAEIAASRGLTPDELEDRTAPDLELDERGTMILDFGPRSFRVGFDEHLRPFVQTGDGQRLDALPRATKADDAKLAKASAEAWKTLKSEAEKVAKDQIARLERMMADERRIQADVFRSAFVEHPLVGHLARRLVWGAWDERGALLATFRVAEDRSLATIDDDVYELPGTAQVGVIHPYALRDHEGLVARWGQQLADYAIIQPFAQLARPILEVDASEVLARYSNKSAYTGLLYGLRSSGWRSDVGEYGDIQGFTRDVGGRRFFLSIHPPIEHGKPSTLHTVSLSSSHDAGAAVPTPIQVSELVFQIDGVLAS